MAEQIFVFVNEQQTAIYEGMRVKHALISVSEALYYKALRGDLIIEDERGFRIDLDGTLREGDRIFTRTI